MYEDLSNKVLKADGEFWESVSLPWDDYDDYLPKEDLNNSSSMVYLPKYEKQKDRNISVE
jgi:hypothetical protein